VALIRRRAETLFSSATTVVLVALLLAGCAAGPAVHQDRSVVRGGVDRQIVEPAERATDSSREQAWTSSIRAPDPAASTDWETFPRTAEVLRSEIDDRAEDLRQGPIGDRAEQLAGLRLAASGRELLANGSFDGAVIALEKAISLYGANGYAYLFLASIHLAEGRRDQAREFTASARRYLPQGEGVEAELEGLAQAITAPAGR
jgi:Flp pilus assembly protein TadD